VLCGQVEAYKELLVKKMDYVHTAYSDGTQFVGKFDNSRTRKHCAML
jgi:hypothetical protein